MQPAQPTTMPQAPGVPGAPLGAAGESHRYIDGDGKYRTSTKPVPVDQFGKVIGTQYGCPKCRTGRWFPLNLKGVPACVPCGALMRVVPIKAPPLLPYRELWGAVERPLRPVWALAGMAAVGLAVDAAQVPTLALLGATPVAGELARRVAVAWMERQAYVRGRLDFDDPNGDKRLRSAISATARTVAYSATGATFWLTLAAGLGMDPSTFGGKISLAAMLAAWAVPAATWWRLERRRRNRPAPIVEAPPEPRALTADELSAAEAAEIWANEVAEPGTKLDVGSWQKIACGWQAVITVTKLGALNALGGESTSRTVKRVAGAYDVRKSAITWIEEHDDSPNKALLLVQPNNPLADGQIWGGPKTVDIVKGVAEAGRFIDGTPMTEVLFKYGWGAPGEVVLGTTGGGKSERIRKRLTMERWASYVDADGVRRGAFISILHDPKHMESYAEMKRGLHGYGVSTDDAHMIVDALLRECYRRYDFLASLDWKDELGRDREGGVAWNPLIHGPIVSAYWDEFHRLAGVPEFVAKLEELARMQRACAMRATIASHMGTLGDTGSQALRDMLAGGRATLFRTTSGLTGTLVTGGQLTADPRTIPKTPGMCLVADGESPSLMGRESYIPKDDDAKALGTTSLYDFWYDADNNPIGYPAEIPPETAEAFGPEFMEWLDAGKRRGGRPAKMSRSPVQREKIAVAEPNVRAADAVLALLTSASGPLDMNALMAGLATAGLSFKLGTVRGAVKRLRDAGLVGDAGDRFELTEQARTDVEAKRAEERAADDGAVES